MTLSALDHRKLQRESVKREARKRGDVDVDVGPRKIRRKMMLKLHIGMEKEPLNRLMAYAKNNKITRANVIRKLIVNFLRTLPRDQIDAIP